MKVKMNRTKASTAQLAYLSEYMNSHREMASTQTNTSLQVKVDLEKMWVHLANQLNALDGPVKTVSKWKQTWRDLKNNVKKKAVHNKNEAEDYDSNDPPALRPMSAVDKQVLSVMGSGPVYGMDDMLVPEPNCSKAFQMSSGDTNPFPLSLLSTESGYSKMNQMPVMHSDPTQSRSDIRRRRRIISRQVGFHTNLIKVEEKKLRIEMVRNQMMKNKNAALNRIADALENIATQIQPFFIPKN